MRPLQPSLISAIGIASLCAGFLLPLMAEETPPAPAPAPTAVPEAPAAPSVSGLPITDAVEGILDEDEPTRKAAFARLDQATTDDIAGLEKYANAKDPEIKKQVTLILKRLKRGDLAFIATFPDGKPVVGVKFNVRVFLANEVQVIPTGRSTMVQWKQPRQGMADPVISGEYTSDAAGKFSVGHYNDGDYLCLIEPTDPLPPQNINRTVQLRQSTAPGKLELKHGVTATVTVTDADGTPLAGAKVIDIEDENWYNNMQNGNLMRGNGAVNQFPNADTDAKGVAVLEKIGMHPIHLIVAMDGYDLAMLPDAHWEDGGTIESSAKLVKTKPVHVKMKIVPQAQKKLPTEARVLLVPQAKQVAVVGMQWYMQMSSKDIDQYIANGAIDWKLTDAKGALEGDALPDMYVVFCFSGEKVYFGNCQLQKSAGDINCNLNVQELPRQK